MRPLLLTIAVTVLLASAALASVDALTDATRAQSIALVIVSVVIMVIAATGGRDPDMPMLCDPLVVMLVCLAQFFVIGPIAMWNTRVFTLPFAFKFPPERVVEVLVAFVLLLVAILVGHRLRLGTVIASWLPDFHNPRRLSSRWIEMIVLVGALAGCFGWLMYQGGLSARLAQGYSAWRAGGSMFRIPFVAVQVVTLFIAWRVFGPVRPLRFDRNMLWGILGFQAIFFGILTGIRKYLLFQFFGILTIYLLRRSARRLPKIRLAVIATLLLVFFSVWGTLRSRPLNDLMTGTDSKVYADTGAAHEGYLRGVAAPMYGACLAFEIFPDREPHRNGSTLMVALLGFIPRAVWAGKPVGIGKEITRYLVGPFFEPTSGLSVAVTLPGDFYINWGWLGIVGGGLFLGILCRTMTSYATSGMASGRQFRAARVLIPAAFVMGLGEVRADMSTALTTYGLSFVPLLLIFTFFNVESDPAQDEDAHTA